MREQKESARVVRLFSFAGTKLHLQYQGRQSVGLYVGSSSVGISDVGPAVGISVLTSKVGREVGALVGCLLRRVGFGVGPSSTG